MNVVSMLSNGYLAPARPQNSKASSGTDSLARQENQILAQERALKSSASPGTQVSVTYQYALGPDGRRYVTGALVEIKGDEQDIDRIAGGLKRKAANGTRNIEKNAQNATESKRGAFVADSEQDKVVEKLKRTEREVIAHEAAHQAAGGRFAGAVSYSYTRGPDGKSYITGGEVPIRVPSSNDPEQMLSDMAQVQRAALAPGNPSGQDLSVAAQAAATAARARGELAKKDSSETEVSSALGMYRRSRSPYGLWALGRGFMPYDRLSKAETPLQEKQLFQISV